MRVVSIYRSVLSSEAYGLAFITFMFVLIEMKKYVNWNGLFTKVVRTRSLSLYAPDLFFVPC